jgi:hypothetical protein
MPFIRLMFPKKRISGFFSTGCLLIKPEDAVKKLLLLNTADLKWSELSLVSGGTFRSVRLENKMLVYQKKQGDSAAEFESDLTKLTWNDVQLEQEDI